MRMNIPTDGGLASVSAISAATGYSPDRILRAARRLGLPVVAGGGGRSLSAADVQAIVRELDLSEARRVGLGPEAMRPELDAQSLGL